MIDELFEKLTIDDDSSAQVLEEYTDYRTYMDYDIKISIFRGDWAVQPGCGQRLLGSRLQAGRGCDR